MNQDGNPPQWTFLGSENPSLGDELQIWEVNQKRGQWASQNQKSKTGSYFPISLSFRRGMPRSTVLVHLSQVKLQVSSKAEHQNPGLPNSVSACECLGVSWYGWSWQIKRWGVLRSVTSISPIETEHDCEAGPLSFLWAHYPLPHIHTWGPLRFEKQKTSSYQLFGKKTAVWPVWKPALLSSRVCCKAGKS